MPQPSRTEPVSSKGCATTCAIAPLIMPRRDAGDVLRPPAASSSRPRPGSSPHASRAGPYTLGTAFANSSSSLVNGRGNASSDPNLAVYGAPSGPGGPVPATEAPHLSVTEAFFGRMTLTAPDNMRRRKLEEKEKKRQGRKKRAERGALAAATIMGPPEGPGPSSAINPAATSSGIVAEPSRRRRKPLPASQSTSNLQNITLSQSRSRSPTRPPRPQSAQTNHSNSQQTSSARTQRQQRDRAGSEGSLVDSAPPRPHSSSAAAPAYQGASEAQSMTTEASHAAQRRRDIYADLDTLGLPGASESDLEDQPPPFPLDATRPLSPPRMPAEGEEWTEEMRRLQEEYEMNRPPDSPPPAFQSEEEGARAGDAVEGIENAELSSSNEGSVQGEVNRERQEWEEDAAAGFDFEERVERDRMRREAREQERHQQLLGVEAPARPTESCALDDSGQSVEQQQSTPLNLGQLVMEARARRGMAAQDEEAITEEAVPKQSLAEEEEASHGQPAQQPTLGPEVIPSQPHFPRADQASHRRVASDGTLLPIADAAKARTAVQARKRAAVGTGPGLRDGNSSAVKHVRQASATKVRSRPSGESHSRFRDGASAAANRRMALWGPLAASSTGGVVRGGDGEVTLTSSLALSEGEAPLAERMDIATPTALRQASSSNSNVLVSTLDDEGSSDSDDMWDKEEAEFEAIQRRLAPKPIEDDDSSDENVLSTRDTNGPHPPGWLRSNSIDLAKPESSVPRAPPPLALGRSRGGPDLSSSSSSSSSSDGGMARLADESDGDDSLSPIEGDGSQSEARSNASMPVQHSDKGKQPVRPSLKTAPSAPISTSSSFSVPAGEFENDSGSSHDFATDDDEDERVHTVKNNLRPPVSNRLKDLFAAQLNSSQASPLQSSSANRASLERLFDTRLDAKTRPINPGAGEIANDRSSARQPSAQMEATREQVARREALEQLTRLQREPASGVSQDSLGALERLLSRGTSQQTGGEVGPARLTRMGAINRHETVAPFVNPRSSVAPRPLGRLPTITNATRHFPPSRQSTQLSTGGDSSTSHGSSPFSSRAQVPRRSGIGTPSWMAYIPANERRALPDPLEPVKKRLDGLTEAGTGAMTSSNAGPPPLPLRQGGSRVSAMVERFEVQGGEANAPPLSPRSPSKSTSAPFLHAAEEVNWENSLRRRPPPPPPPSSWRRHGTLPTPPIAPARAEEDPWIMPTLPPRPSFLPNDEAVVGRSVSEQALHSPQLPSQLPGPVTQNEVVFPRTRSRPLPIPPVVATSAVDSAINSTSESRPTVPPMQPVMSDEDSSASVSPTLEQAATNERPARAPSLGFTDLDLFASRLADQAPADGTNFEDLHLLAEFLGPAKSTGASVAEIEALSVGVVEVLRKRIVGKRENGKDKIKLVLNVMGVKVERCAVCLVQFKEGNLACLFPCLHVLHEDCAARLLRNTKLCPSCRIPIA